MNIKEFKETLGKLPTGVSIITTTFNNHLYGFTASSFTSVSLTPLLVSFCLNKSAKSIQAFSNSGVFAVSILAENQENLSRHFSNGQDNKFSDINYELGTITFCPLIKDTMCCIECVKVHEYAGGDHTIFIGEVKAATINNDLNPLVYFSRSYRKLK